ncbi:MAG: hypothetical protein CMC74_04230 [Flavobacteriaceae bacterium]|nr:hypothetical protein [Flavobacteriaceae bacterium]
MKERKMKERFTYRWMLWACLLSVGILSAQEKEKDKAQLQLEKETQDYIAEGSEALSNNQFSDAEVNYRKAIAINPSKEVAKYNLGNAYYNKAKNEEAMRRFKQAASVAKSKPEKHKAFHNLGNTFMNAKQYQEAVEAYKSALRNDPTDDETRYNLALAKEMLEKNPPQGGDGEDENQDQQENQDQNQDQNNENQDSQDQNNQGDDGDNQEDKDQGDENKDQNQGENEGENEKREPKDNKSGEGDQPKDQKQQPIPGQMSPQQIKNLLEAMNNEEKKVQDKINVQKQKGAKVKSNKDW